MRFITPPLLVHNIKSHLVKNKLFFFLIFFIKLILIKFKNQLQSKSKIGKDEHDYVIKNDLNLKASFLFADIVKQIESVFSVLSVQEKPLLKQ